MHLVYLLLILSLFLIGAAGHADGNRMYLKPKIVDHNTANVTVVLDPTEGKK